MEQVLVKFLRTGVDS